MKNYKRIFAIGLICIMAVAMLAGCKKTPKTEDEAFEQFIENLEELDDEDWEEEETVAEIKEAHYEASKEIIEAPFSSTKIQIADTIFDQYGMMTVKDFYEKYKNDYYFGWNIGKWDFDNYSEDMNWNMDYTVQTGWDNSTMDVFYMKKKNSNIQIEVSLETPAQWDTEFLHLRDALVCRVLPNNNETKNVTWLPSGLNTGARFAMLENAPKMTKDELVQFLESKGLSENTEISNYGVRKKRGEGYHYDKSLHTMYWQVISEEPDLNGVNFVLFYAMYMDSTTETFTATEYNKCDGYDHPLPF